MRSTAGAIAMGLCLFAVVVSTGYGIRPTDRRLRILAVETVAARSHWNFMKAALRALVDRGHRVTVYTPFPDNATHDDRHYVEVDTSTAFGLTSVAINMNATVLPVLSQPLFLIPFMANGSRFVCDVIDRLLAERFDADSHEGNAFDVFVTEPLSSDCVSYAASRLGLPLIYIAPAPLLHWIEMDALGHRANPSYEPHLFSAYKVPDTFYWRIHNVVTHLYTYCVNGLYVAAVKVIEDRPYDRVPPVTPSIMFVNTHYITEPSRPVPTNRVDVGGLHLNKPRPLPADLLQFIEGSPNGAIFVSLGTVIAFSTLPDHVQNAFKDALAEIPQRVLFKYEGEMKNKPKNVMVNKFFPQRDLLMHPKMKLFISHGGIASLYEAVDAGVPVIGFPLFYDQPRNVANLVDAGMAISFDLMSITKDKLLTTINEIVNNETYTINAKIVSEIFKDRPMTPAEAIVYWTEYVVRHRGAPHLKSHALNLTWYQYYLLDVTGIVVLVVLLLFYACYITIKALQFIKRSIWLKSKCD